MRYNQHVPQKKYERVQYQTCISWLVSGPVGVRWRSSLSWFLLVRLEQSLKVPRAQVSTNDSVELASIQSTELKDPKSFNCKKGWHGKRSRT